MKDHSDTKTTPSSNRGCLLFSFLGLTLIFMMVGCMPSLSNIPGIQARFTGQEAVALISMTEACTDDDGNNGIYFTYTFTDTSGESPSVTDNRSQACTNNLSMNGQRVMIWYQLDDPSHLISDAEANFDIGFFFVFFSLPLLAWIVYTLVASVRGKRMRDTSLLTEDKPQ